MQMTSQKIAILSCEFQLDFYTNVYVWKCDYFIPFSFLFELPLIFLFFKLTKIKSSFSHTVIIVIYDSAHIPLEWWMF